MPKTMSVKVSDDLHAAVKNKAKQEHKTVSALVNEILSHHLNASTPSPLYVKDTEVWPMMRETISSIGFHRPEGQLYLKSKDDKTAFYVPEAWYFSTRELSDKTNIPEKAFAASLPEGHALVRLDEPSELVQQAIKSLNLYALGNFTDPNHLIEKVFGCKIDGGSLLLKRIDPLRLKRFCTDHPTEKVIYLLETK